MIITQKTKIKQNRKRYIYENMNSWGLIPSQEKFMTFFVWLYKEKSKNEIMLTNKMLKEMTFFSNYSDRGFKKLIKTMCDKHFITKEKTQFNNINKFVITKGTILKIEALTKLEQNQFAYSPKQREEIIRIAKAKWDIDF